MADLPKASDQEVVSDKVGSGHASQGGDADVKTTDDAFLGGLINILQPQAGYRAGLDAVLLASAIDAPPNRKLQKVLDVGSGVGTVGLCAAARLPGLNVTLLEREPLFAALATENIKRNALQSRCNVVTADVTGLAADHTALGLVDESFDYVVANPPFHTTGRGTRAPNHLKSRAHAMEENALEDWARFMVRMTAPGGCITFIHKAQSLPDLLTVLSPRFGGLVVLPIVSHQGGLASRVLVRGVKGSRAEMSLLSPFIVHSEGRAYTPAAEAILRHGAALDLNALLEGP